MMPDAGPSVTLVLTLAWAHVACFAMCILLSWAFVTLVKNGVQSFAPERDQKIVLALFLTASFLLLDSFSRLWTNEDNWRRDARDPVVNYRQETIYCGNLMGACAIMLAFIEVCLAYAWYLLDSFGIQSTSYEEFE